ncbi:hypothetical protein DASB73_013880 [Starmerella bacillaris]|uniref:Integral membrane bound transporter domain-containing protein n=1 Tax=Starmerella bacillaris TaxID=1247836 RepID=A0AAV5RGA9_STABA|nr:hypothetical protein DASB73_013880 [Starmerella bacillaris]
MGLSHHSHTNDIFTDDLNNIEEINERTPLLKENLVKEIPEYPQWSETTLCSFTYMIGSLFVFSPLRFTLGTVAAKHIIATTSVWVYPVRTLGNMIEVVYYVLLLVTLSTVESVLAICLVRLLQYLIPGFQHSSSVMLICVGCIFGLLGYLKVKVNKLSFNTAATMNIIYLTLTLVREDMTQEGKFPVYNVLRYLQMILTGVFITSMVSFLLYRKTARAIAASDGRRLQKAYIDMLCRMVSGFGTNNYPSNNDVATANVVLSSLKDNLTYARYEMYVLKFLHIKHDRYLKTDRYVNSLQRQSMYLGGMHHCVKTIYKLKPGIDNSLIKELHTPMTKIVWRLRQFVAHPESTPQIFDWVNEYIHDRDVILNKTFNFNGKEPQEDSLLAIVVLFLFLLEEFSKQLTHATVTPRESDMASSMTSSQQHSQDVLAPVPAYFSQLNDLLNPKMKAESDEFSARLWRRLRVFKTRDMRHGLRVGLGSLVLAYPAFNKNLRPIFLSWHGEWAVITYMIIMARNLGAMTDQIPLRVVGTIVGAISGVFVAVFCKGTGIYMFFCGLIVSWFCFRRILSKTNPVFGRFIMLTYNLVCLYGYSLSRDESMGDNVISLGRMYEIAFHRCVGVIIGVLWAVFITLAVWPFSARQSLRANLCIQWMRMGMTWKSDLLSIINVSSPNGSKYSRFKGVSIERELQNMMMHLDVLLKNSPNEFRLRGKFNARPYQILLDSTQRILDALHSVSILIENEPDVNSNERSLVFYTAPERYQLSNSLFLQFYTASTSVRLGFPVPEYLEEPKTAMENLVNKLKSHRMQLCNGHEGVNPVQVNYDFLLFYSYLMLAITISAELQKIHKGLRTLFGTLDDDALFAYV